MTRAERLEEIAQLARACREAQRLYFADRSRERLIDAKVSERVLDDALANLNDPKERVGG